VLALAADIPEGGGVIKGDYVITQPASGTYKAFSKVCTHAGCDVSKVDAGVITCPCHNSTFSIEDGKPTGGPAQKALPETKIKVDGDNIVSA
jgi:Rieske Fe-S protein